MLEPTHHLIEEASRFTYDELKSLSDTILDMLDDKKWDELFASPKSIAYATRRQQELLTADTIPYIPGKSLADLFR
jgi:hypothetical protein